MRNHVGYADVCSYISVEARVRRRCKLRSYAATYGVGSTHACKPALRCLWCAVCKNLCSVFAGTSGQPRSSHGRHHPQGFQFQGHSPHRKLDPWREVQGSYLWEVFAWRLQYILGTWQFSVIPSSREKAKGAFSSYWCGVLSLTMAAGCLHGDTDPNSRLDLPGLGTEAWGVSTTWEQLGFLTYGWSSAAFFLIIVFLHVLVLFIFFIVFFL